jgi:integrase
MAESFDWVDQELEQINKSLSRCKLYRRDNRFVVRGYFPSKPGHVNQSERRHQVALNLTATKTGLKAAIATAKEIDGQLILNKFDWEPWLKPYERAPEFIGDWVDKLAEEHWAKTPQTPNKINSWNKDYKSIFDKLPRNERLTLETLKELILKSSKPGSRGRRGWCLACVRLATFAGLEGATTLRQLSTYDPVKSVQPRTLPSDEEILDAYLSIQNPAWKNAYALMAVYGLRNHEVFRCDFSKLTTEIPVLEVSGNSKTGQRVVYPCAALLWKGGIQVSDLLPNLQGIETKANNDLGEKIGQYFRKVGVTEKIGKTYNLRHCYARRCFEQGWPLELAARSMGHDVMVHHRTYQAFMAEADFAKVFKQLHTKSILAAQEEAGNTVQPVLG